jgi:ABC-type uncharacterized transport system, ATPase component
MPQKASADISLTDTADKTVSVKNLTKLFYQSQPRGVDGKEPLYKLFSRQRKEIRALDDVSFEVARGEFVAYAGPNGAGKSTTMKLLGGILLPTAGKISVLGLSPERQRIALMSKLGILFGNRTELWWDHPVITSFEWKKAVWNIPDAVYKRNLDMAAELLELRPLLGTFTRELSLGQRMRCDIAMMLLHSPELILLDEPTLGLDVVAKRQMIEFLKTVNREDGVTIMVTSHDMDDLEEMARRIMMVSSGRIAYDGDFAGLRTLTGTPSHISVTVEPGAPPPNAPGIFISERDGVYEFELDTAKIPVSELLARLSASTGIKDVEIKKAPIEQVIAELFRHWSA